MQLAGIPMMQQQSMQSERGSMTPQNLVRPREATSNLADIGLSPLHIPVPGTPNSQFPDDFDGSESVASRYSLGDSFLAGEVSPA